MRKIVDEQRMLTPAEVGELFRVHPKTINQWAAAGKLPTAFRTPGGHRRFREAEMLALLNGAQEEA